MDVHVRRSVTEGLRLRGVDVITAQIDNSGELPDAELLDRVLHLNRVLFTQDDDFLVRSHYAAGFIGRSRPLSMRTN